MSDFSGLGRSFVLPPLPVTLPATTTWEPPLPTDVQPRELRFLHLRGAQEIARIAHLRAEIRLPASVQTDAGFALREKKETKSASSARFCASAKRSAPSA